MPFDAKYVAYLFLLELFECFDLLPVHCPEFTAIQKDGKHFGFVDGSLSGVLKVFTVKYPASQYVHRVPDFPDSMLQLLVTRLRSTDSLTFPAILVVELGAAGTSYIFSSFGFM